MWEELQELIQIAKRESAKSIAGVAVIIGLAFLLYQNGSDEDPENPDLAFESQEFERTKPKINTDDLEKVVINDLAQDPEFQDLVEIEEKESLKSDTLASLEATNGAINSARSPSSLSDSFENTTEDFRNQSDDNNKRDFDDNLTDKTSDADEVSEPDSDDKKDDNTSEDNELADSDEDEQEAADSPYPDFVVGNGGNNNGNDDQDDESDEEEDTNNNSGDTGDSVLVDNSDPPSTPACVPSKLVFPDKGPGTYSVNPLVSLYSPDSKDIRYCITTLPGSCNPEPSLDGLVYNTGGFNVGATTGIYIVSFLANDDPCAKKYRYSYVVDNTYPDIEVSLGTQFLQTTERVNYTMDSVHSGNSNFYFWFLKVGGEAEFSSCNQLATDFDITNFGMDFLGDTNPKDLNSITTPLTLDYYAGKKLAYGKEGNQFVSFIQDQTTGNPATYKYGCQMNQVFVYDFPHFEFKSNSQATINGSGEVEFSGSFQPYGPGRFPASAPDIILESGIDNIIN